MAEERKHAWRDRVFTLFTLLLGAAIAIFSDYWKTYLYIDLDTRAYILYEAAHLKDFELHATLVNSGNRQSIVSEFIVVFPFQMDGGRPISIPNSSDLKVEGIPVVLNPGDMRLVTIKGILPIKALYQYGSPIDPAIDSAFTGGDVH